MCSRRTYKERAPRRFPCGRPVEPTFPAERSSALTFVATVAWAAHPLDPFFNANTFGDLAEAERLAAIDDRALAAAPQGAKMRQKSGSEKQPAEDAIRDIRRATGRLFSAEEKIRVVLEGLRGEESIADGEGFGG